MRLHSVFAIVLVAAVASAGSAGAVSLAELGLERAACIIDDRSMDTFHEARGLLPRLGAKGLQMFPPDVIFGFFPPGIENTALGELSVTVIRSALELETAGLGATETRIIRDLFHEQTIIQRQSMSYVDPGPLNDMLLRVPEDIVEQTKVPKPQAASPAAVLDRGIDQNSEFMIGTVVVNVIFPESDGASEDWTDEELADAKADMALGISQYMQNALWVDLSFIYQYHERVPISYEPIENGDFSFHQYWLGEALSNLGYSHNSFWGAHMLNNEKRLEFNTDWAFTAFVVDMSAHYWPGMPAGDPGCWDAEGYVAYAYLGGPFMVVPFPACRYGYDLGFGRVFIHEMSHIFWALDEYASASQGCGEYSGYIPTPNRNTLYMPCQGTEPCIMQSGSLPGTNLPICRYTMAQVGLCDENENSIPDIYEIEPGIKFIDIPGLNADTIYPGQDWVVSARAVNAAVPNLNPRQVDSTRIDYAPWIVSGEYSISGSPWTDFKPSDGVWDGSRENIGFFMTGFTPGMSQVLFKIENCIGLQTTVSRNVYYIGMQYYQTWTMDWTIDETWTEGDPEWIEIHWKTAAEVFGAVFDIYRADVTIGTGEEYVGTVEDPEDAGQMSKHYKYRDEIVEAGHEYHYRILAHFDLNIDGELRHFEFLSNTIKKTAMIPVGANLVSNLVPNPTFGETVFSVDVPETFYDPTTGESISKAPGARRAPGLLEKKTFVDISVYNVRGERVKTIYSRKVFGGMMTRKWDGTNESNRRVSPGIYFVKIRAGELEQVKKAVIIQ